jgi:hypothetical protein
MVKRTFFDRNNTIIYNNVTNTGRNPVAELFYGGRDAENKYSRFLFYFDETNLKELHTGGTYTDLSKLKHTLRLTNTGSFDKELMGKTTCDGKDRACSFDLILFPIGQTWDEGVGYDYDACSIFIGGDATSTSICPSNWVEAQTNISWSGGNGTYTGSTTAKTKTIHFEQGNENIELDISDIVNGYLTGGTNHGLGLAFTRSLELTETGSYQYVGFFTRHTQTFYEPHVETVYDCHITDDRANFYLDKPNKLYLYVNAGGEPTNLDVNPSVQIIDNNGAVFSSITSNDVTHVTKGVYCVEVIVPTTSTYTDCYLFNDIWGGITIGGVARPDIEMDFALVDSNKYYNIGNNDTMPQKYGFNVSGIRRDERIKRGDIRRVQVTARIPYTTNQTALIDGLQYRLYVKEGRNEYTVIDFQDVERSFNHNYFLLDTESLIPNTYYLDIKVSSNNEITTIKDTLSFDIVSQSELRISQ